LRASDPLFLDLDGVILDVSKRHYQVHRSLLAPHGEPAIDGGEFWRMKRRRRPLHEILAAGAVGGPDEDAYRRGWLELIESPDFLGLDTPIEGAAEALEALRLRQPLILVTLRRQPDLLLGQLDALGLRGYFDEIRAARPQGDESWRAKASLIEAGGRPHPGLTILGDTEVDIRAGKALLLRTVAVTSGIRDRALLEAERPDLIIDSLRDYERNPQRLGPSRQNS
jgi:phosphoglycolate phosphatase-like HAD superfamily hydrolase